MELPARGVPLRVAAIEVGVSRSAAQIWKNGTTVRRKDGTVKVPPLEPHAVRRISPRFLSEEERVRIADMASRGDGPTVIGQAWEGPRQRSAVSCAATCMPLGSTARSTPRSPPRNDAGDPNSRSSPGTRRCARSSSTGWRRSGARNRSAVPCARRIPTSQPCGWRPKVSTWRSIGHRMALSASHRRCAPAGTTGVPTLDRSGPGYGSPNPCSASTTAASNQQTAAP